MSEDTYIEIDDDNVSINTYDSLEKGDYWCHVIKALLAIVIIGFFAVLIFILVREVQSA